MPRQRQNIPAVPYAVPAPTPTSGLTIVLPPPPSLNEILQEIGTMRELHQSSEANLQGLWHSVLHLAAKLDEQQNTITILQNQTTKLQQEKLDKITMPAPIQVKVETNVQATQTEPTVIPIIIKKVTVNK